MVSILFLRTELRMKTTLAIANVPVFRHYTNKTVLMTVVRATKTLLILEDETGMQIRISRDYGADHPVKCCYSVTPKVLQAILAQI